MVDSPKAKAAAQLAMISAVVLGCLVPALAAKTEAEVAAAEAAKRERQRAQYETPKALRELAGQRKAELASIKVGVGAFRHQHTAKPADLGLEIWQPQGEPTVWDFDKAIPESFKAGTQNGQYRFYRTEKATYMKSFEGEWENYSVRVKVRALSAPDDRGYGLFLNAQQAAPGALGDGYSFTVSKTGQVWLFKLEAGKWVSLKQSKWENLIGKEGGDILYAEIRGGEIICMVNDQHVFTVQDKTFAKGVVGFTLDSAMDITFDDLVIQPLSLSTDPQPVGSGYDYAEEVLKGMAKAGLFPPANLGISNSPPSEDFSYVVEAEHVGYAANGGVKVRLLHQKQGAERPVLLLEDSLPLPAKWDAKPGAGTGAGLGATPRDQVMQQLGDYLAYLVAEQALTSRAARKR